MKDEIIKLLREGKGTSEIAGLLGCSKSTVSYHAKIIGLSKFNQRRYNWEEISSYQKEGHSVSECQKKFNISPSTWSHGVREGKINKKDKAYIKALSRCTRRISSCVLREAMIEAGFVEECSICGIKEWLGKKITIQIDHIDGDGTNNTKENLRFLCPNCHSQTDTYGARNKKSVKLKMGV